MSFFSNTFENYKEEACGVFYPAGFFLNVAFIFTIRHCAWQKGTNENLNGLLREFYPKGHNLERVSEKTLKKNLALINARPKKVLHYQKPVDLFNFFLSKCCS